MKQNRIVILLLVLALLLTGCADMIDDSAVRADAEVLLRSFIEKDPQTCRSLLSERISQGEVTEAFELIAAELADLGEYTMNVVGWNFKTENGMTIQTYQYQLDGEGGSYYLYVTVVEGEQGIAGFHLSDAGEAAPAATNPAGPLHWAFFAVGLVGLAFTVWMLVDCARRRMKRKWLWVLLILFLSVLLTFTMTDSTNNVRFNIGAFLGITSIETYAAGGFEARFYIPLGALVYFFRRKELTAQEVQSDAAVTREEQL